MNFQQSVKTCLGPKYLFAFNGRASRSEFWWFMLFIGLVNFCAGILFSFFPAGLAAALSLGISLALFPANLGVTVRRLHDRNLRGWWLLLPLLSLVPFALGAAISQTNSILATAMCLIYLIILCMPGQPAPNRFGPPPVDATSM